MSEYEIVRSKMFPVSWDQFHRDARALAWRLSGLGSFHALVAITRGGLVPAAVVARELSIRVIETVAMASYSGGAEGGVQGERAQSGVRILKPVSDAMLAGKGAGVLIVDDLVDTGATARAIRALLPQAHFAAVYAKPAGRPLVDTFITEVSQDTWIHFPWDLGLAFQPPLSGAD